MTECTARSSCTREVDPPELTCPVCVGNTRNDLTATVTLAALMPEEAEYAGINSEAATLAGPTADPTGWFIRRRHVMGGGLCRCPKDQCPDLTQPVGPACEECSRKEARQHPSCAWVIGPRCPSKRDWLSANLDEDNPAWTLGIWDMMLREDYGLTSTAQLTLASAAGFLDRILHRFANDPEQDFPLFAREIRDCRRHLEAVVHDSRVPEKGAPCPACASDKADGEKSPNLVKFYVDDDPTGSSDWWGCPDVELHWWTDADYRLRIGTNYLAHALALTADQMRDQYRIAPGTLRRWAAEGKVKKRGRDGHGRQLYDVAEARGMREVIA